MRVHYIDVLKGLGIVFVVVAHCNTITYGGGYFYSFHMALFFFISGMLMNTAKYNTFRSFLLSRIKQLYVPYVVFYCMLYLYWLFVERHLRTIDITPWEGFVGLFYGTDNNKWIYPGGVMWFVISLMVLELLMYVLLRMSKSWFVRGGMLVILTAVGLLLSKFHLYILPFSLNNALLAIPYFMIGYLLRRVLLENNTVCEVQKKYLLIALLPIMGFTILFYPWICEQGLQTDISGLTHPAIYVFYTLPFIEIALWLIISMLIGRNSLWEWLGRNTLPILAFHPPISRIIIYGAGVIIGLNKSEIREDWIYSIILSILTIICCWPFIILWNKVYPQIVAFVFRNN